MITPNRINEAQVIPLQQYVNAWASTKYKELGGTWRKAK